MSGEADLAVLLRTMEPRLHDTPYEFRSTNEPSSDDVARAMVLVREDEGITLVVPCEPVEPGDSAAMACITLTVHSSLAAVGLTAAVSTALAERGIACNVVAGFHHDHLFVPWASRDDALDALHRLAGSSEPTGCVPGNEVA